MSGDYLPERRMKPKPNVGDTLYLYSNFRSSDDHLVGLAKVRVAKVGRAYFSVSGAARGRFRLSDWGYDTGSYYRLYASVREREDEIERSKALLELRRFNDHGRLSTSALHEILAIIGHDLTPPSA